MNLHEEQFARAFILPGKQERYLSMLQSPKGRARLLANFPHCKDLNMNYAALVPPDQQNANAIAKLLANKGALDLCHVISADPDIDNREMPLANALEETVGMNIGTFISCIPGKLGYFEFEEMGQRYIFAR
jgi:hypothetical protein